ncbi:unnamed protein product [Cuscuta campestris]|uniref:CCHC-type domain-containing protein n=1 Tax=Cuscuta campestris TaxID=132261 RepID=A0A484MSD1_9ASTE|nr:unnamed protein product [Cuscuta campestris]
MPPLPKSQLCEHSPPPVPKPPVTDSPTTALITFVSPTTVPISVVIPMITISSATISSPHHPYLPLEVSRIGLGEEDIEISFEEIDAGPRVDLPPTWIIAGCFPTSRPIKFDAMKQVLAMAWKPALGVYVTQDEEGLYLFHFYHVKDAMRIIDEGPWSFDNPTLVCKLLSLGEMVKAHDLHFVEMWVQIHNLPFGYTTPIVLETVGKAVGSFIKHDSIAAAQYHRSYHRVRISVDVRNPLRRRLKLTKRDGIIVWIHFKYERLNTFCFFCGIMGHLAKHCRAAVLSNVEPENYPFDGSLRAEGRKKEINVGSQWLRDEPTGRAVEPPNIRVPTYMDAQVDDPIEAGALIKRKRGADYDRMQFLNKNHSVADGSKNVMEAGAEKRGGAPHPPALIAAFTSTLEACDLFDLGMMGYSLTWDRCRGKPTWVEERLDRAVATVEWRNLFSEAYVSNQAMRWSDHSALFLSISGPQVRCAPRSFRFENAWLLDDGYKGVITAPWNSSGHLPFPERLKVCGSQLVRWGGDKFNKFGRRILEARRRVDKWRGSRDPIGLKNFYDADADLARLLDQEDVYWRQRAKQH